MLQARCCSKKDSKITKTSDFTRNRLRKFIKAFLVRHQIEFPKTHDIGLLRQLVARVDPELARKLATADALTPYGVEFRYPGDLASLSRNEGEKALRLAEQTRDLIIGSLQSYINAGRPGGGAKK